MKNNMKNKNIFVIGTIACLLLVGLGITVVQLGMVDPVISNLSHDTSNDAARVYVDAQTDGGYSQCYFSGGTEVTCDVDYTKVVTTVGSGCQTYRHTSLSGIGLIETRISTTGQKCDGTSSQYGASARHECLDLDGMNIVDFRCYQDSNLTSDVAACCK